MMARAFSGSRSSIISVDPLISANSAVTVLRSPSSASDAALSSAILICDLVEESVAAASVLVELMAVPHFLQNRAPILTDALQAGQINSSFAPHPSQNEASEGLSWLHLAQSIGLGTQLVEQRLGVLEIGSVEALGEPVVDVCEHRARLVATIGVAHQSCEAGDRSKF